MSTKISELAPIANQQVSSQADVSSTQSRFAFTPGVSLRRHPIIAAATFLVLMGVGGFFIHRSQKPLYNAQSIVYVSPTFPHELVTNDDHEHDRQYDPFMEQQIIAVTRPDNLKQALNKYPNFWTFPGEDLDGATARLQKALKVEQMEHSYQMSITLSMPKKDGLADFVNEVTAGYLAGAHNDEFFGHDERLETLGKDRAEMSAELNTALQQQDKLMAELGVAQYDSTTGNPYDTEMAKLREELAEAHERRAEADAQMASISHGAVGSEPSVLDGLAGTTADTDPALLSATTQLNARKAVLLLQMNGLTPQNPLYVQAANEIKLIDKQMEELNKSATNKVAGRIDQRYGMERERALRLESQLNADLSKTRTLAVQAAPKIQQSQILNDKIQRLQTNLATIDNRLHNLILERNSPGSEHVVSWAVPPSKPMASHATIFFIGLFFVSLIFALIAAVVADAIDPNIYTSDDVRRLIGFPPIGLLLDEEDFSEDLRSEYLLRLAAGIDQAHRRTGARMFVFTSAGIGDTRELVKDLGTDLADNGLATLVVLVGPAESKTKPTTSSPTAVATANSASSEAQTETRLTPSRAQGGAALAFDLQPGTEESTERYRVITHPPQGLPGFLRKVNSSYNTILIGADPVLLSAHTEQLVRVADGTVLVAESGRTTKRQLTRVAKLLERLKISGIAVVLSHIDKQRADGEILANIAEYAHRATL